MTGTNLGIGPVRGDRSLHDDPEMSLLIDCARASIEPERAERIRTLATADLNSVRLLKLARRHGLAPLLHWHVNKICGSSVPAGAFSVLRDDFQKSAALSLLLVGELIRLLKVLQDNGIEAVPYKGPAMALRLYGHAALRQFCDLDILVRESDVWKASRLIESRGFRPEFRISPQQRARVVRNDYVRLFHRDAGRTLVELHWGIAPRSFAVRFDADIVWQRLEPMSLMGAAVFMPCAEELLLMLCVHGSRHGWDRLEGVASINALLRREPDLDWERVWCRAGEMHCRRMLVFGLLLAHRIFATPLPPQTAAMGRSRRLLAMTSNVVREFTRDPVSSQSVPKRVRFQLRLKDSRTDQILHCLRLVSTTTAVDWPTTGVLRSASFTYPVFRAIRLARKYRLSVTHGGEAS
jgi:Uncharacterised nucleotidyltransferase